MRQELRLSDRLHLLINRSKFKKISFREGRQNVSNVKFVVTVGTPYRAMESLAYR